MVFLPRPFEPYLFFEIARNNFVVIAKFARLVLNGKFFQIHRPCVLCNVKRCEGILLRQQN
jgi:hypothetical protein